MVTRRPLELTLVHSPAANKDYGVFPQLDSSPIYDFSQIQRTLSELNDAVPSTQWVSAKPIELTIYSRNVPDLCLVDLPGYIQINNRNQPAVLRDRIQQLCETYIKKDNIILAVCAADVDLANSEALRASRRVDPLGERTIGVITKLDLVDPAYGASLIENDSYPLKLGYVGVVCQAGSKKAESLPAVQQSSSRTSRGMADENAFFHEHQLHYGRLGSSVGISSLRSHLTAALQNNMGRSMALIVGSVEEELGELRYQLKVQYNDRNFSPETYVSYLVSSLKTSLREVTSQFTRSKIQEQLRNALQRRLLSIVEGHIWTASNMPSAGDSNGEDQLNSLLYETLARFTRSGIGRLSVQTIVESMLEQIRKIVDADPFEHHPAAREKLLSMTSEMLRAHSQAAIEQVENSIKPYKYEIEFTEQEWRDARERTFDLFRTEEKKMSDTLLVLQKQVGTKRLRRAVQHLQQFSVEEPRDAGLSARPVSHAVLDAAQQAVQLNHRIKTIRARLGDLQRDECSLSQNMSLFSRARAVWSKIPLTGAPQRESRPLDFSVTDAGKRAESTGILRDPCQARCPEIYLSVVAEKLLANAALFIHFELVREFLSPLPDELSTAEQSPLAVFHLDAREAARFARENPAVAKHLDLLARRRALELVRDKLMFLNQSQTGHGRAPTFCL